MEGKRNQNKAANLIPDPLRVEMSTEPAISPRTPNPATSFASCTAARRLLTAYSRSSSLLLQAFYCQDRAHPGN